MEPTSPPKPISRTKLTLIIISIILFISIIVLLSLLAVDAFTIPYLTPLAHFLAIVISPFIPFIFPFYLSLFLKVCSYPKTSWPGKNKWIFITAAWGFSHTDRVIRNTWKIWGGVIKGEGIDAVCGLEKCRGKWVEEGLIVLVVIAHLRGWAWDGGVGRKWIESIVDQEKKKIEAAQGKDEVQVMEKGEVLDDEKSGLMVGDEIESDDEEELLVDAEEQVVVQTSEEIKA